MAKKFRQMPKAGFYVRPPSVLINVHGKKIESGGEITYTTGNRGGGGHRYIRFDLDSDRNVPSDLDKWATLQWSCVPGKKELPELFYAETLIEAVKIYNSGITKVYSVYPKYKMEKRASNTDPIKIV